MTIRPSEASVVITTSSTSDLIQQLIDRLSEPVDSYWNGSHTWFTQLAGVDVEWRLHPVSDFLMPEASRPEDLLELAVEGQVDPTHYWEGVEVFSVDDEHLIDSATLASAVTEFLELEVSAHGNVDHDAIGDAYERAGGKVSLVSLLINQMNNPK